MADVVNNAPRFTFSKIEEKIRRKRAVNATIEKTFLTSVGASKPLRKRKIRPKINVFKARTKR